MSSWKKRFGDHGSTVSPEGFAVPNSGRPDRTGLPLNSSSNDQNSATSTLVTLRFKFDHFWSPETTLTVRHPAEGMGLTSNLLHSKSLFYSECKSGRSTMDRHNRSLAEGGARSSPYDDITNKIIAWLEQGRGPKTFSLGVQPQQVSSALPRLLAGVLNFRLPGRAVFAHCSDADRLAVLQRERRNQDKPRHFPLLSAL
jgi:hypothetical protein